MRRRRPQLGGGASLALLASVLTACTIIGTEPVAGWPQLAIYEHHVSNAEMRERCVRYTGFGATPMACAEFNLAERRCDIWFSADFPPPPHMVEHERKHCLGYDHLGMNTLAEFLARYRDEGPLAAAAGGTARMVD